MSRAYKTYALILMTVVFGLNDTDRVLMGLLLEPIKRDLSLSDTQLGFVTGIAFAFFYATAGLPLARLADRGNRSSLTASAIGLWSLTVMGCVLVASYAQLVVARIAAAIGEAGCKPPTYSLVGDYFPKPVERTRAMAVYWLGSPIGALIAFALGGWLNEQFGWRMTFFIMGIPGLLLALLVKLTLADPRPVRSGPARGPGQPPLRVVLATLWQKPATRHLSFGLILTYAVGTGALPWLYAFLIRAHGLGTAELGLWLGILGGISGAAGVLFGGYAAVRWFPANEVGQMRMVSIVTALLFPLIAAPLFLASKHHALLGVLPFFTVLSFFFAPIYGLLQRLVGDDMRATALAVVTLFVHLIGMGLGPLLVGVLSDLLAPWLGIDSLRAAILIVSSVAFLASYHFWRVGRTVKADLAAVSAAPTITTPGL